MKYSFKDFLDGKIVAEVSNLDRPAFNKMCDEHGLKFTGGQSASKFGEEETLFCVHDGKMKCGGCPIIKTRVNFRDLLPSAWDLFLSGAQGIRCDTREQYDHLMRECEGAGKVWAHGLKPTQSPAEFAPAASYSLGDPQWRGKLARCFPPCDCGRPGDCGHKNSVPFSAVFPDFKPAPEPWSEFAAKKCWLRVNESDWDAFAAKCKEAGIKWQCGVGAVSDYKAVFNPWALVARNKDTDGALWQHAARGDLDALNILDFSTIAAPAPAPQPAPRPQYKVGDLFKVTNAERPPHPYFKLGDVVKLVEDDGTGCPFFKRQDDGARWPALFDRFTPYTPPPSFPRIEITTDGRVTTATLYEGGKAVKTGTATCAPEDKFDAMEGACLAFNRLKFGQNFNGPMLDDVFCWAGEAAALAKKMKEGLR